MSEASYWQIPGSNVGTKTGSHERIPSLQTKARIFLPVGHDSFLSNPCQSPSTDLPVIRHYKVLGTDPRYMSPNYPRWNPKHIMNEHSAYILFLSCTHRLNSDTALTAWRKARILQRILIQWEGRNQKGVKVFASVRTLHTSRYFDVIHTANRNVETWLSILSLLQSSIQIVA